MVYKTFGSGELFGISLSYNKNYWIAHGRSSSWIHYGTKRICATSFQTKSSGNGGFKTGAQAAEFTGGTGGSGVSLYFETKGDAQIWLERHNQELIDKGIAHNIDDFWIYKTRGTRKFIPCPLYDDPDLSCWVRPVKLEQLSPKSFNAAITDYPFLYKDFNGYYDTADWKEVDDNFSAAVNDLKKYKEKYKEKDNDRIRKTYRGFNFK